jgi:hypothetical protein
MIKKTDSRPVSQADSTVKEILQAASSWAKEAPESLTPAIRAVCVRLAEMVADQRHYLVPLPEPQESERRAMLESVAGQLRSRPVIDGIEDHLGALAELELRSTGSWATVPSAQSEWVTTAIQYLEGRADALPEDQRPDPYWADDVVAGIIASVRAVIGVDELAARNAPPPEADTAGNQKQDRSP